MSQEDIARNHHLKEGLKKMNECIIAMKSQTLMKRANRALSGAGIRCEGVSIDPSVTKRGCGYGIAVSCRDAERAAAILDRKHITHGEVIG